MPDPEIRRLTAADLPVAKELRLSALRDAPQAFLSTYADTAARTEEQWVSWIEAVTVFGAFLDGEPAGMVGAIRNPEHDPGVTELISMWVSPDARGHRIAGRLADAVIAFARDNGDKAVHLEVIAGNAAAESAYLKSGFRHIGKRKEEQRDQSMWLDL